MKEFDNIAKELPYKESPQYVENLVERCAAKASASSRVVKPWFYGAAVLAAAAAVALGVFIFKPQSSPMDSFLASLSDEEVSMIVDWPVTDIPEYYE